MGLERLPNSTLILHLENGATYIISCRDEAMYPFSGPQIQFFFTYMGTFPFGYRQFSKYIYIFIHIYIFI